MLAYLSFIELLEERYFFFYIIINVYKILKIDQVKLESTIQSG